MKPLVSILIPCYNSAPWLAETLDSALAQTWTHTEIIVINDGSTDDSPEIVRRYRDRGVIMIDQPNRGQSAAFNRGMAAARGDFLEFLDADDLLAPDKIERQVEFALACEPEAMISGCWARFVGDPASADFPPNPLWHDPLPPVEWLLRCWRGNLMMHGAAWLVPGSLARRFGGWNEELSLINDFEYFSRLILQAPAVRFCPQARTYYRSEIAGSLSRQRSPRAWLSAFTSITLGVDRLLGLADSPSVRDACACVFRQFYFDAYPQVPELRAQAEARVLALGGVLGRPAGGPVFRLMSAVIGWRAAKRLQLLGYRWGYRRVVRFLRGRRRNAAAKVS
jgi:glycosyltransferase involved in cell wall biosynthesis